MHLTLTQQLYNQMFIQKHKTKKVQEKPFAKMFLAVLFK